MSRKTTHHPPDEPTAEPGPPLRQTPSSEDNLVGASTAHVAAQIRPRAGFLTGDVSADRTDEYLEGFGDQYFHVVRPFDGGSFHLLP